MAQRCIPTIFDTDNLINLTLNNDANVTAPIDNLNEATLSDIEDGTL